jgi:hypothetical protein
MDNKFIAVGLNERGMFLKSKTRKSLQATEYFYETISFAEQE